MADPKSEKQKTPSHPFDPREVDCFARFINRTDAQVERLILELGDQIRQQGEYDQEDTATIGWDEAMDLVAIVEKLWTHRLPPSRDHDEWMSDQERAPFCPFCFRRTGGYMPMKWDSGTQQYLCEPCNAVGIDLTSIGNVEVQAMAVALVRNGYATTRADLDASHVLRSYKLFLEQADQPW